MSMKKGMKKLLAGVGLLAVVVPASLSVAGCDFNRFLEEVQGPGSNTGSLPGDDRTNVPNRPNVPDKGIGTNEHQIVVDAINSTNFELMVKPGFDADTLKSAVCVRFIGSNLPVNIQKIYNPACLFKHDIVNEHGVSLSNADLQISRTINARILYDYAEIRNQSARFTLIVE